MQLLKSMQNNVRLRHPASTLLLLHSVTDNLNAWDAIVIVVLKT
jgi:hypothetical protein